MATRRGDLRVLRGTTIHGPMTRDQLAGLMAAGRVAGTDLVSVAEGPWNPVAAYLGRGDRREVGDGRVEGVGTTSTPSSSPWHYARGGSQFGPVSGEQLKELAASGNLLPTDLIWREGLPDWRPASTLRGLFPEAMTQPAGPPPLPTAPPAAASEPSSQPGSGDPSPSPSRKPDFFDRARDLTLKAKAKAESIQREAQTRADRLREQAQANPPAAPAALARGVRSAVDYARSEEGQELVRRTRDAVAGGARAASALAGAASAEGRDRVRRAAEQPLIIGAALLGFFPLGLYLVWHHPRWTSARKCAWTGVWLGCFGLMLLPAMFGPRVVIVPAPISTHQEVSSSHLSPDATPEPKVNAEPTIALASDAADKAATITHKFDFSQSLFLVASEVGPEIYAAAKADPNLKVIVVSLVMQGIAVDRYGKKVEIDEELGRLELNAEEVRKYVSQDAYLNRQIDPLQVEMLQIARRNGRGLFSDWKVLSGHSR